MATVFTQAGEEAVVDLIDGTSANHLDSSNSYVAWGTGAGTAAKGDTTLFTEASESRVNPTESQSAVDILQFVATITATGSKTITEAGLFDAASSGNLIIHGDHSGQAVGAGDKIEYTITLEMT